MLQALLDITDPLARFRLTRYLNCLQRWSSKINLTGAETPESVFRTLIFPILGAETLLTGSVIDVGAGNGSPGLVLAAQRPDLRFTLLEPRAKRWAFLREAVREMGIETVDVVRERSDTYRGSLAHTVTMRAVGLAPSAVRTLLLPGGSVLVFGGPLIEGTEAIRLSSGAMVQRQCFT